jgi:hypothetical protein
MPPFKPVTPPLSGLETKGDLVIADWLAPPAISPHPAVMAHAKKQA